MTDLRRREAILLAAALGGAAALGTVLRPSRAWRDAAPSVMLETAFPAAFGSWRIDPLSRSFVRPATDQGRRYEIYEQVLERTYIDAEGRRVMLSVAAGNDRTPHLEIHVPEDCYRASGYEVSPTEASPLATADRRLTATRLFARRPGRSEPITYWIVFGDRVMRGSALWDRVQSAKHNHEAMEGMLVRISSIDADPQRAWPLHDRFANDLAAALAPPLRSRVFGSDAA